MFLTQSNSSVVSGLINGLQSGQQLQEVTAPPGLGKTTLLRFVMQQLERGVQTAFVFQTDANPAEFLGLVLAEFGITNVGKALPDARKQCWGCLQRFATAGEKMLLIVDEAQNLSAPVIREIGQLLEQFSTSLQIILSAQASVLKVAQHSSTSQLNTNISGCHSLRALDYRETGDYVRHRLTVAGHSGPELFTSHALRAVAEKSGGVPRLINRLCSDALAQNSDQWVIDSAAIERAVDQGEVVGWNTADGGCEVRGQRHWKSRWPASAAVAEPWLSEPLWRRSRLGEVTALLREKEADLRRVESEVQALRSAARLLSDE